MKTITLVCENCHRTFERRLSEYKRCQQKKYAVSCGRTCGAVLRNRKHARGNSDNLLRGHPLDEFSPLRFILGQVRNKAKARGKVFCLTLDDVKQQWDAQKGKCPYTGYTLQFPSASTHYKKRISSPYFASLDRIDSSKGYVQGNVEFVCLAVNYAKNGFSKEQMIEFFRLVTV